MSKSKIPEHKVVAHCISYLIACGEEIIGLSVNKQHIPAVKRMIRNDLKTKYSGIIREKQLTKIIKGLEINSKEGADIELLYYSKGPKRQHVRKIEAKGDGKYNVKSYSIYTLLGQLVTLREKESEYWWFGAACPSHWKSKLHEYLTFEGKIKPIIKLIIEKFGSQSLKFYFVKEDGYVENPITWKKFLTKYQQ